jgi:TonB-linked SusC/RagA family outer membrane protein
MKKNKNHRLLRPAICLALCMYLFAWAASAQNARQTVRGVVADETGEPLAGASIVVKGSTRGVSTDENGAFNIDVSPADVLEINYLGYETLPVKVGSQTYISVKLEPKKNELDEVTVVAFAHQKKESVISAISTVNVKDIRIPSSNLTTAFQGRIAGMISYQTSGEPGYDDASFFIRGVTSFGTGKVDPLILIDNIEVSTSDLAKLHPDDLQSFSILKDATATALYGARGANGVILVTTKEGQEGKVKVNVRIENTFSSPTQKIEMADPITYMKMANEAVLTRDPLGATLYSRSKIADTENRTNPDVFPSVDWMDYLVKDITSNQRANINISGGGQVARYYVAASVTQDNGMMKVDKINNFNSNVSYNKYTLRSNINLNLTKSSEMIVRLSGTFSDYSGPISGGSGMYQSILDVSPVRFLPYYQPDKRFAGVDHILFGNEDNYGAYMNPYAELMKGYKEESTSAMMAQIELKQDFGKWLPGLTGRVLGNTTRNSAFDLSRAYSPYYYSIGSYDRVTNEYTLTELNSEGSSRGTEYLEYYPGDKTVNSIFYGEASLAYNSTFADIHNVSGMLVGTARNYLTANAAAADGNSALAASLPQRNIGLSGRFTYNYDSRYFAEFNFGYNGSEKFDKNHRFGFFPSFGAGWLVSNEPFWAQIKDCVSLLKLRYTYGLVGNDNISALRFFYISNVNPNGASMAGAYGYDFNGFGSGITGYNVINYPNPNITWEIARKHNIGIELGLFKDIELQVDIFSEERENILQSRADIPISMGLHSTPLVNVGKAKGKGVDISLDYNHSFSKDLWLTGRANFTYAHSEYLYYEEPNYEAIGAPWRSVIGRTINQQQGYIAEGLFIDQNDVDNSPRQDFSQYGPGDIKYKDLNKDNVINELDLVAIGYPTTPEINYGFGFSGGYRYFDVSAFFSGSARSSFFIDPARMAPFVRSTSGGKILERGLSKFIADDYWSEDRQNPQAAWPRLSTVTLANNTQRSTFWMRDNPYLRFKSLEAGWSLPHGLLSKLGIASLRLYFSGTNLLLFSDFKLWDIELGGNGLNYPLQRTYNIGLTIGF